MKHFVIFLFTYTLLYSVSFAQTESFISEHLKEVWVITGLDVPESVLPVPEKGILYVSNIGARNPSEKEGKGFISVLGTDGRIKNLKWCTELNSPKGMAIVDDKLFVTEVDRIAEIELKSGKKIREYNVEGAKFLNDIAADPKGNLYISDSQTGTVHKLSKGELSVFISSETYGNPNGVIVLDGSLFLGTGSKIVQINTETKSLTDYMINTGSVDGIARIAPDKMIFSNWAGTMYMMKKGDEKELIFDSSNTETSKTADFGYDPDKNLIYVPTFFSNSVICYRLNTNN
jgi:hypothetical protein